MKNVENTWNAIVALHPEGVDRNVVLARELRLLLVALHPEGVDRNIAVLFK